MAMQIEDGGGTGRRATVDNEQRLDVHAVTATTEHDVNHRNGEAYHLVFSQTPTGANDCFLYIKNNSDTKDLCIEGIWFRVASAEQVLMKLGDTGTTSGGTTATPANLNAGSGKVADGTFEVGNDITGLSGGTTIEKYWLANTASSHFNFEQDIIIPKNGIFTMYAVTGAVAIAGTVVFNFHTAG
jgi:hypothetical protein